MSTTSPLIQSVEDLVPLSDDQRPVGSKATSDGSALNPFRMLIGLLVLPPLVILAILGFLVVLADFALFRLSDLRHGHPQPKGLWEF